MVGMATIYASEPSDSELLDPIVWEDPNWNYPAYFIPASDDEVVALKRYLQSVCAHHKLEGDVWFCGSESGYIYSGVDGWGKPSKSSYACERQIGLIGMRFFGDYSFHGCFFISWDQNAKSYEISAPKDYSRWSAEQAVAADRGDERRSGWTAALGNMEAQQLISAIEAAFPVAPLPEMTLHQAKLADQSMSRKISEAEWSSAGAIDAGRTWKSFADEELMACDVALAHFVEDSFVYYLPAFLVFAVRHCSATWPDRAESLVGTTMFSVTHRDPYSLARYKRLNSEQQSAVIAFLEFIAENGNHHERPQAEKALKRYWRTDEVSKPLIIVP
jgi:hypothetical protein